MNNSKTVAATAAKPTNGTTQNAAKPSNGQPQPETKKDPETSQPGIKLSPVRKEDDTRDDLQPLEDRLHRLNVLFDLQKRFNRLHDTKSKLEKFAIAADRENSELTIQDDDGNEFTTSNPLVIAEVQKVVLKIISEKTAELASQLKW